MLSLEFLSLEEVIHGSEKEKEILRSLKSKFGGTFLEVKTKEWVQDLEVYVNGKK